MQNGYFTRLSAYRNIDCTLDIATRKSPVGYMAQENDVLVGRDSFKQRGVADSSTEAEFVYQVERIWNVHFVHPIEWDLGGLHRPTVVSKDNPSCLLLATERGKQIKHVQVHYHICRRAALNGEVRLKHCPCMGMITEIQKC